jgi:hypothetical protein
VIIGVRQPSTILALRNASSRASIFNERRAEIAFSVTRYVPQQGQSTTKPRYVGGVAFFTSLRRLDGRLASKLSRRARSDASDFYALRHLPHCSSRASVKACASRDGPRVRTLPSSGASRRA